MPCKSYGALEGDRESAARWTLEGGRPVGRCAVISERGGRRTDVGHVQFTKVSVSLRRPATDCADFERGVRSSSSASPSDLWQNGQDEEGPDGRAAGADAGHGSQLLRRRRTHVVSSEDQSYSWDTLVA